MSVELEKLMSPDEAQRIGIANMSEDLRKALHDWGIKMYQLGQHVVADIRDVKYDGRLIILDDGTRWEVDDTDSATAEDWSSGDKVVIIDNAMYKLDDMEKVDVEEED